MEGLEPELILAVLLICAGGERDGDPFGGDDERRARYVDALESYGVIEARYGIAEQGEDPHAMYPVRLTTLGEDFLKLLQDSARPERSQGFFRSRWAAGA